MVDNYDITLLGIKCPKCSGENIKGEIFSPIVESWIECKKCGHVQSGFVTIGEIKDWLDLDYKFDFISELND